MARLNLSPIVPGRYKAHGVKDPAVNWNSDAYHTRDSPHHSLQAENRPQNAPGTPEHGREQHLWTLRCSRQGVGQGEGQRWATWVRVWSTDWLGCPGDTPGDPETGSEVPHNACYKIQG